MSPSDADPRDRLPGRPKTAGEIRGLVIRIRKETNYGYTKLLQTLRRLGVVLSRQTVKNILVAVGLAPPPNNNPDNWDSFLKRHAETLWQIDVCSKPMWTIRGIVDVYLLVCLHLGTRRMWISPCTVKPDAAWVAQQARNFLMHAEDVGLSPKLVIHDRDTKFTFQFDEILTSAGCAVHETTPLSPNLQAHVERAIQILKHECLNAFVVVSQKHLNDIVREFQTWYNWERGHSARDHLPPACERKPEPVTTIKPGDVVCTTRLGGHLKTYSRRAA
jgi:putative transposase